MNKIKYTLKEIYKMIFDIEFHKQVTKKMNIDTANRKANIHAVKYTTKTWKRMYCGKYRNLFNQEKW